MSESNGCAELLFEFSANGSAVSTTVTAKIGDDVVEVDKFDPAKSKSRDDFINRICKARPGINRVEVERVLKQMAADHATRQHKADDEADEDRDEADEQLQRMPQHVRDDARCMLESPDLLQQVINDVATCGVAGERELVCSIYLVGVSRLLPRPLAAIVQAPSSTGKSYVVEKTAAMFPPESVIHATAMTAQSLYYLEPGVLCHRFVVAGERSRVEDDSTAEATRALREMISAGRLSKLVPMKENGRQVTQHIEMEGPIAYVETTTLTKIFDEDANRCLLLNADERQQQTAHIVSKLAAQYAGGGYKGADLIVQRHYAAQRMIKGRGVVIPYAEKIAAKFDTGRVEARRAFPHCMGVIQASAVLHQFQRQIDGDGKIIATVDDYAVARHLVRGPLARLLGGQVSDATVRFYDRLVEWRRDRFNTTEAAKRDRKSEQAVRGWLRDLVGVGAVEQVEQHKGSRPAVWKLTDVPRDEVVVGDCGLPTVEEIS